jgi:hypothetical protein
MRCYSPSRHAEGPAPGGVRGPFRVSGSRLPEGLEDSRDDQVVPLSAAHFGSLAADGGHVRVRVVADGVADRDLESERGRADPEDVGSDRAVGFQPGACLACAGTRDCAG